MDTVAASLPNADSDNRRLDKACLLEIVRRRREQVLFRLANMALVVACYSRYAPLPLILAVGAIYLCIQIWERYGLPRTPSYGAPRGRLVILPTLFIGSAVFGLPSLLWGLFGGAMGLVCSAFLLSGSMLNAVLITRGCRSAFFASAGPFLLYVPVIALIAGGPHLNMAFIGSVAVAGCSMIISAVAVWRDATVTQASEAEALDGLRQREVELAAAFDKAKAANLAKTDFLANMSHEIRTPLNGVVAVADLLARADLAPREREMVGIICASGETLQSLLSDILDMSRIESGKISIETAPFHAGDMVRAVAALSQLKCDEKGVRLVVDVAPELDRNVVGDLVRVRQIVTNFLSNAVKFTDHGEVRLTAERTPAGLARFSVSDTGMGFPQSEKAKVLGRFEQADSSITRRFGGAGLGLSICSNLAELMGGSVDCSSEPGRGSLFWTEVPLEACAEPAACAGNQPAVVEPLAESLRILLADDHPTNRKVVELMLADGVARLTCVEDGEKALTAFQQERFDLILMDMQMPVMDGLTAIREIRRLEREGRLTPTPIIMLTANALPEHVSEASAVGADLHLAKPFTTQALFAAISTALPETDSEAELAA